MTQPSPGLGLTKHHLIGGTRSDGSAVADRTLYVIFVLSRRRMVVKPQILPPGLICRL